MQRKWEKKLYRIASIATALFIIAAIVGAIWNLSLYLFNTDVLETTGLHAAASGDSDLVIRLFKDNALTMGFIALCVFVIALFAILAVIMGIKKNPCTQTVLPERRGALQIIRIFTGFALLSIPIIYAVFALYGFELGKFNGIANQIAMILALPACLYFLFPGIADRFSEFLQTVFGICFIGFVVLSTITTHSYMFEGLTSPVRACNLLSLVAMMLFMLYEIRFFAAKPLPNMYLACAGLSVFFCGINGLPRLILTMLGEMKVSVQTMYACLEVTIALYAACRMLLFLSEWSYTMQNAALTEDEILPDTVSLSDPEVQNNTVEPDYTEDSEIESPILEAEIDLAMYDLAFDGLEVSENDALDELTGTVDEEVDAEKEDPLSAITPVSDTTIKEQEQDDFDPLDLLAEIIPETIEVDEKAEEVPNEKEEEEETAIDQLDTLSDMLFGEEEEKQ